MKLYFGNLQFSTTEAELNTLFSKYGEIKELSPVKDRHTGEFKGFGFIEMRRNSDADKAIKALNGSLFQGRTIKVNQAQAKSKTKNTRWRPGMY